MLLGVLFSFKLSDYVCLVMFHSTISIQIHLVRPHTIVILPSAPKFDLPLKELKAQMVKLLAFDIPGPSHSRTRSYSAFGLLRFP